MNQKGLTYFLILVFVISAGTVFSKSASDTRSTGKAESIFQKGIAEISLDFSAVEQTYLKYKAKDIDGYQSTHKEKLSSHSLKNYLLSERYFAVRENSRRTSIWFTSRLKN